MESFLNILIALTTATGLAGLIGLEREMRVQNRLEIESPLGGLSTFFMMGALGFLGTYLSIKHEIIWLLPAIFTATISFLLVSHAYFVFCEKKVSALTAFSLIVSFIIGVLVAYGETYIAIAVSILFTGILALRDAFHLMAKRISIDELLAILQFFIVTAIILPILPKSYVDPFGFFDWRPQIIWLMVVLVVSIRFVGYFLAKFIGGEKSMLILGVIGGFVSSTAVTTGISRESRDKKIVLLFLAPILIATGVMFFRVILEVFIISGFQNGLLELLILPLGFAGIVCVLFSAALLVYQTRKKQAVSNTTVNIEQPMQLSFALVFGLFFLLILLVSDKMAEHFAGSGLYLTGAIAGLTDVDAITLAMANLVKAKAIAAETGSKVILLAVAVNTLVKLGIVFLFGSLKLFRALTLSIAILFVFSLATYLAVMMLAT